MVVSYWTNESKGTELESIGQAPVGGSASPFIDEGDGFTGERERVRMILSLVAHADEDSDDGRRHNTVDVTVECQVHRGGCVGFFSECLKGYGLSI